MVRSNGRELRTIKAFPRNLPVLTWCCWKKMDCQRRTCYDGDAFAFQASVSQLQTTSYRRKAIQDFSKNILFSGWLQDPRATVAQGERRKLQSLLAGKPSFFGINPSVDKPKITACISTQAADDAFYPCRLATQFYAQDMLSPCGNHVLVNERSRNWVDLVCTRSIRC